MIASKLIHIVHLGFYLDTNATEVLSIQCSGHSFVYNVEVIYTYGF